MGWLGSWLLVFLSSLPRIALAEAPVFDGSAAFKLLEAQCDFGPRNPGGVGHQKCLDWMVKLAREQHLDVTLQPFEQDDPRGGGKFKLTNVVIRIGGGGDPPLMFCAHWDTRPVADQERDPLRQAQPIIGANDGASGVAILLQIARLAAEFPPPRPLLIVLFDGEDIGREGFPSEYAAGARFWVTHQIPEKPAEAILLDMVGDADLRIPIEPYSEHYAPALRRELWQIAEKIGSTAFVDETGPGVEDDHVPLIKAGIPAVDLIDFDYPPWHTLNDTVDKCSPESLSQVGRVLVEYLYR